MFDVAITVFEIQGVQRGGKSEKNEIFCFLTDFDAVFIYGFLLKCFDKLFQEKLFFRRNFGKFGAKKGRFWGFTYLLTDRSFFDEFWCGLFQFIANWIANLEYVNGFNVAFTVFEKQGPKGGKSEKNEIIQFLTDLDAVFFYGCLLKCFDKLFQKKLFFWRNFGKLGAEKGQILGFYIFACP